MRAYGIRSECVATGREALEFLRLYDYDLVLMDLRLSDGQAHVRVDSDAPCLAISVPVLVVSDAAAPLEAKVKVLDQGADDFLATPCDIRELMARIRAVVRRSQGHTKSALIARAGRAVARSDVRVLRAWRGRYICRGRGVLPSWSCCSSGAGHRPEQGRVPQPSMYLWRR